MSEQKPLIKDKCKIIEYYDEDCGWQTRCEKCDALVIEVGAKECLRCHAEFTEIERV
jgi:hypothetical protein